MDDFASPKSKTAQGFTELEASSLAVGLPEGLMGNSEVGHLNIGAGRVVWQDVCIHWGRGRKERIPAETVNRLCALTRQSRRAS